MKPGHRRFLAIVATLLLVLHVGCTGPVLRSRSQSPERTDGEEGENRTKLVGNYAAPYNTQYIRIEAPVLITGLKGTGSDPPPGPQRAALLADMQARKVQKPNQLLADPNNSIAWARAYLPPGVQQRDRIDVEVRVPAQVETTSLAGGWMMQTRLQEMAVLGGQVREGHVKAIAQGPVLVDPVSHDSQDPMVLKKGLVLGGGEALKSRNMGLILAASEKSVYRSKQIGDALNRRFHTFHRGIKRGIATPKTDEYVEILIHPRYKHNLARYFRVIRAVPLGESPQQQLERMELLEQQLLDPITAAEAAIKLEAIGNDALRVLEKGLQSKDPEVRFYAAEALAYLDESSAVTALAEAAKNEPAFRAFALAALSALNDVHAADALRELFDVPSAETRYGAFRALWAMNERDPQLRGEHLADKIWLHVVPSAGPAMVHVTHSFRPEVVLFGDGQKFKLPITLEAGNSVIVKSQSDGQISVARFAVNEPDRREVVENSLEEVIRAIAEVGGDYPDVVHALQQARTSGALTSRFEVDAIPERGRIYDRNRKLAKADQKEAGKEDSSETGADESAVGDSESNSPIDQLPTLFGGGAPKLGGNTSEDSDSDYGEPDENETENSKNTASRRKGFWVK